MNLLGKFKKSSYGTIVENTVMLAILQFSNIFLSLLTSGYQARIFSDEGLLILSFSNICMPFFQLFIDFGFIISATGKIARHRDDAAYVNKVFSSVMLAKVIFIAVSSIAVPFVFKNGSGTWQEGATYWLYMASIASFALLPDFVYRGFERMSTIAVRSVTIKVFATILTFVFAKQENDYYMMPLFTVLGNVGAIAAVYFHLFHKMGVHFCRVTVQDLLGEIKDSGQYFVSRIASTVYGRVNGLIVKAQLAPGLLFPFEKATMVTDAARNGLVSPIADSIYPHIMKNRNFNVIKKALRLTLPIMIAGCSLVFIFAEPLCKLWLGDEKGAMLVLPLRALLPVVVISLPNYILGFPTLSPMGLAKQANISISLGTIIHLINLAILYFSGNITLLTLCLSTSVAESVILAYRIIVIYKNRHLLKESPPKS